MSLTFDDGPSTRTPQLVDLLHDSNATATFFLRGDRAEQTPESVRYAADHGIQIGNHSMTHPRLTAVNIARASREIGSTQRILTELTGNEPIVIRPPFNEDNDALLAVYRKYNLTAVYFSVDSGDWRPISAEQIASNVLDNVRAGSIVILHDYPEGHTLQALPKILQGLASRSLCTGVLRPDRYNSETKSSVKIVPPSRTARVATVDD